MDPESGGVPEKVAVEAELDQSEELPLEERRRLARELMDGIVSNLSGLPSHERAVKEHARVRAENIKYGGAPTDERNLTERLKLKGGGEIMINRNVDGGVETYTINLDYVTYRISENGRLEAIGQNGQPLEPIYDSATGELIGRQTAIGWDKKTERAIYKPVPPDNTRGMADFIKDNVVGEIGKVKAAQSPIKPVVTPVK